MNKGNVDISLQLGKNIAMLRKSAGLTQAKLAELVGVETLSISRMERGAVAPSIATLSKIADAIEVPISSLFLMPESFSLASDITEMLSKLPESYRVFVHEQMKDLCAVLVSALNDSGTSRKIRR